MEHLTPITLSAQSPAKINLFLHITARKPDGYHCIESLFCPITLHDTVHLRLRATNADQKTLLPNKPDICRTGPLTAIPFEKDLTVRACMAFFEHAKLPSHWSIEIEADKQIPEQAGLGGGSSNAATVLRLLQKHFKNPIDAKLLLHIAGELGADVPFFLQDDCAFIEGIGEQITPVGGIKASLLVYKPKESCATQEIFSDTELTRNATSVKIAVFDSSHWIESGFHNRQLAFTRFCEFLETHTTNSLQHVVQRKLNSWAEQLARFNQLTARHKPLLVRMSGSGSAMFAVFAHSHERDLALQTCLNHRGNLSGVFFGCEVKDTIQQPESSG